MLKEILKKGKIKKLFGDGRHKKTNHVFTMWCSQVLGFSFTCTDFVCDGHYNDYHNKYECDRRTPNWQEVGKEIVAWNLVELIVKDFLHMGFYRHQEWFFFINHDWRMWIGHVKEEELVPVIKTPDILIAAIKQEGSFEAGLVFNVRKFRDPMVQDAVTDICCLLK
jgi:hypothetical protein